APGSNWRPSKAEVRRIIRRQHNPCSTTLADRLIRSTCSLETGAGDATEPSLRNWREGPFPPSADQPHTTQVPISRCPRAVEYILSTTGDHRAAREEVCCHTARRPCVLRPQRSPRGRAARAYNGPQPTRETGMRFVL